MLPRYYTKLSLVVGIKYRMRSVIILSVRGRKRKKRENAIFESIRKPVAPPTKTFGDAKPEERAHPAERKIKHKRPIIETDE